MIGSRCYLVCRGCRQAFPIKVPVFQHDIHSSIRRCAYCIDKFNVWNDSFNKGFDLLKQAVEILHARSLNFELAVFGNALESEVTQFEFPTHYFGHLHDDISLRIYTSAKAKLNRTEIDSLAKKEIKTQSNQYKY